MIKGSVSTPSFYQKQKNNKAAMGEQKHDSGTFCERLIVQKYLETPALIMDRKFDVRVYMIILCCKPYVVLSSAAFARTSLEQFSLNKFGSEAAA